jgi:tetratricopeptide (TPR) repeat protein
MPGILEAQLRHARHYETVLRSAEDLYVGGGGTARALELLDSELSNIQAGQAWAEERSGPEGRLPEAGSLCMGYAHAGRRVLLLRLPYPEYKRWQLSAQNYSRELYPVMNKTQQERVAYLLNEMICLNNTALAHEAIGEPYPASLRFKMALDYADELGDSGHAIDVERELALAGLARTYSVLDNGTKVGEALKYHEMRLALARKLGNRRGEAEVMNGLGFIQSSLGRERGAVRLYQPALAIARELDDLRLQQEVLANLGDAYFGLRKLTHAIENFRESLDIARRLGDLSGEETVLISLATAYGAKKGTEMRRCVECYEQSLAISRKTGNRWRQFGALFGLGISYAIMKDPRRAIESFRESAEIAGKMGVSGSQAEALYHMSRMYEWLGDRERAVESSNASLKAVWLVMKNEDPLMMMRLVKWNEKLTRPPSGLRRWFQSLIRKSSNALSARDQE